MKKVMANKDSLDVAGFDDLQIGAKLKFARRLKGLRLKELANAVGCSESFLSKVENDKVRPSLQTLHSIVSYLNTTISDLFSPLANERNRIMRKHERPKIATSPPRKKGSGVTLESLVPGSTLQLLYGSIHVVAPGGSSEGMIAHQGEEIGYILEGELELTIDNTSYSLGPGDSFFFQSNLPHGYRNPGDVETRVVWINTPPTF
jgi:transcriptional regulator with XRE-family HTH domain